MAEQPDPRRLYDDRQIGALIQRATELQERETERQDRGLSLEDIERIAGEIGISPVHLRAAAVDLESRLDEGRALRLFGGPYEVASRRIVHATVSDEQWEHIVSQLRRITGGSGSAGTVGQRREWTHSVSDMGQVMVSTEVTLSPTEDRTTIELRSRFGGGARLAYFVSLLLGGGAAGIFLDGTSYTDLVNALVIAGGGAGGVGAARLTIGYWARRRRDQLRRLAEWMQEQIAAGSTPSDESVTAPEEN